MSALDNLRKKGTILTLGEDELPPEIVRSYLCFYDKTGKEHKETKNQVMETQKRNNVIVTDNTF